MARPRRTPDPSGVPTVKVDPHVHLFAELFPSGRRTVREKRPDAPPPVPPVAEVPAAIRALADDPARRFGKYVRTERLGQGGMAEVWKAWDLALGRWVALKFLKYDDPREIARFRREALVAARLSHPHIAAIYGAEESRGKPFIVMQYVAGRTLRKLPGRGTELAARLLRDAALAVHAAHEKGVIHRDLKPDNLMVEGLNDRPGKSRSRAPLHLYVMDFGLAKHAELEAALSTTGDLLGTPLYMSPEQARGARGIDRRTDVYSLGATLYELLTGRPPFNAASPYELIVKVVDEEPPPPRRLRPSLDRDLETIVLKCMQKDAARRYATALDLAEDLSRWLEGRTIRARASSLMRRSSGKLSGPARFQAALLGLSRRRPSVRLITETAARMLGVERVSVWLFGGRGSRLECLDLFLRSRDAHEKPPPLEARRYPLYFMALRGNRVVAAGDARTDPRTREFARDYLEPLAITSMMDAPVRRGGKLAGVLCHEHTGRPRAWTLEEQEFASSLADLAAVALETGARRRAEEELRSRTPRSRTLQTTLVRLSKLDPFPLGRFLRTATKLDARALGVERVSVWLFSADRSRLECLDLYRRSPRAHEKGASLEAGRYPRYFRAQEADRVVAARAARTDPRTREFAEDYLVPLGITSMMDVPIRRGGKLVGVVCHEHTGPPRRWSLEEQGFASSVADLVAVALEAAERRRMQEELRRLRRGKRK